MARWARSWLWLGLLAVGCANEPGSASAQTEPAIRTAAAAPADVAPPPAGKLFSAQELDELVARVALYPDPLLALVLPASTNPLGIVQAQRFLDANTGEEPPETWDPAIISLLNYPEVVKMMNDDLEWTQALGDAVGAQQADVMDAVQQVRAQTHAAGNLETTKEQKVIVEKEVVKIVPADPEVIYVPQYNPTVIYAPAPAPIVSYYPPRPCYWCSAAAFGTGMFIGAATTAALTAPFWAFDWHRHDIGWGHHGHGDFDFDIDRDVNINNNFNNSFNNKNVVNKGNGNSWKPSNKPGNRPGGGGSANRPSQRPSRPDGGWNNPNRPGGGGGGQANRPSTRPSRPGQGGGGVQRPGQQPAQRPGGGKDRPGGVAGRPSTKPGGGVGGGYDRPGGGSASQRPSGGASQRPSASTRPGGQKPRDSKGMGNYQRGQDSYKSSQRGSSSRQKSSAGSSRQRSGGGGGSYNRSSGGGGKSMGNYKSGGNRSSSYQSRGSSSRGGGGGGHRGGGGGGGGGRGGGGGGGRGRR